MYEGYPGGTLTSKCLIGMFGILSISGQNRPEKIIIHVIIIIIVIIFITEKRYTPEGY